MACTAGASPRDERSTRPRCRPAGWRRSTSDGHRPCASPPATGRARPSTSSVPTPKSMRHATSSTPAAASPCTKAATSSGVPKSPLVSMYRCAAISSSWSSSSRGKRRQQVVRVLSGARERGEGGSDVAQQTDRGPQVLLHRVESDRAGVVGIALEVGVQHERDAALAFVAGLAPCAAVARRCSRQLPRPTGRADG